MNIRSTTENDNYAISITDNYGNNLQRATDDNESNRSLTNPNNRALIRIAKDLQVLSVKNIYYATLAKEFYNDGRYIKPIEHTHNTRRRAQGRFKVERFTNEYGRSSLPVTLPTILNKIPTEIISITHENKRNKLIKEYLMGSQ